MQCLKQLGALCPYINNSNKSLPTEKCLLTPFWKAVIYSTLEGRDRPVKREHGYNGRVENPQDFDKKNLWTLSVKTFFCYCFEGLNTDVLNGHAQHHEKNFN